MGSKKNILICDDKVMNRKLIEAMLIGYAYTLIETESGLECLDVMQRIGDTVDLILLDINMKDMSGIDVCRALRSWSHCNKIPIIAYTASVMRGEREKYLAAGFDEILMKPTTDNDLFTMLNTFIV